MMKPYIAIVHKDPASAYGVTFPDAPGCFSAADDIDDLFANAAEAITLWTEAMMEDGQKIPAPRDLSELKRDPKMLVEYLFRDNSFPNGCFLMTGTGIVPPNSFTLTSGDKVRITIGPIGTLENEVA